MSRKLFDDSITRASTPCSDDASTVVGVPASNDVKKKQHELLERYELVSLSSDTLLNPEQECEASDAPDGGFKAWLVVAGVSSRVRIMLRLHEYNASSHRPHLEILRLMVSSVAGGCVAIDSYPIFASDGVAGLPGIL